MHPAIPLEVENERIQIQLILSHQERKMESGILKDVKGEGSLIPIVGVTEHAHIQAWSVNYPRRATKNQIPLPKNKAVVRLFVSLLNDGGGQMRRIYRCVRRIIGLK